MRRWLCAVLSAAGLLSACAATAEEDARLSAIVSLTHSEPTLAQWLEAPSSLSYVEAYVMLPPETGEDVIFGIDQEFIEGVKHPLFVKGGDWMGLIGLQRGGAVWIAKGTAQTMDGTPSKDRSWEILTLGQPLKANTWYSLRSVLDFKTRHYVSFTIEGPGLKRTLDLQSLTVDYPNYMPFDGRMLTHYTFAMRGKSMRKDPASPAVVYFDDMRAGLIVNGRDHAVLEDNFESGGERLEPLHIPFMTFLGAKLAVADYKERFWYLEQKQSRSRIATHPSAHSGNRVALCDATLASLEYDEWFSGK